jgi:broad specificity phosphatase PhoE
MKLVLIRHGQTPSNVSGLLDTAPPGAPLTALGREQAAALGVELADHPLDGLFCSTALRAQQTAELLRTGVLPQVRDGLFEVQAGDWEMSGDPVAVRGYLDRIGEWLSGDLAARTPGAGGESGYDVMDRLDTAIAGIVSDLGAGGVDRPEAWVVAHGAVIRVWASLRSANLPDDFGAESGLRNATRVEMVGDPVAGWTCTWWSRVLAPGEDGGDLPGGVCEAVVPAPSVAADPTAADVPD